MKRKLFLAIALCILTPCTTLVAQIVDVGALQQLQELRSYEVGEEDVADSPPLQDETQITRERLRNLNEALEEADDQYGYTGRKDFIISPQSKTPRKSLRHFGYEYFVQTPTTFASVLDMPVPPDYILGPGDEIKILLFGIKNRQFTRQVTREGEVFIPELGTVSVNGLTYSDLRQTISEMVAGKMLGTKVNTTLGLLRSLNIFILGEASQPGMYTIGSLSTLTNAIFKSGGIRLTGSLRNIQVKREGNVISTFDFYELLLNGDTSRDMKLKTGDVIFIPPIGKTVAIDGEVERPGIYELKEGETAEDLIHYAGRLKPKADISSIEIQSIDPTGNGFNLTSINANQLPLSDLQLNNGDVLTIYPVVNRMGKAILFTGHTPKSGFYPWREGMKILDLFTSSEDLLPMTDMNYILIKRQNNISQTYQTLQVDLEELLTEPDAEKNINLQERDEIIFFPALLTPDLINIKLIENKKEGEEEEQQGLVYARKFIEEIATIAKVNKSGNRPANTDEMALFSSSQKYYSYSVHDYCTVSEELVKEILNIKDEEEEISPAQLKAEAEAAIQAASMGIKAEKTLQERIEEFEDTERKQGDVDYIDLKDTGINPFYKSSELTDLCRRQLLDPLIALLERQGTSEKNQRTVDVFGNVTFPGRYPLSNGATLEDALKAAGGLRDGSYADAIQVTSRRLIGKENVSSTITTSFATNSEPLLLLRPFDVVTVKKLTGDLRTVKVSGEVFFPGTYQITKGETLASIIEKAGGVTAQAFVEAGIFQRESLKKAELIRLQQAQSELKRTLLFTSQSQRVGGGEETKSGAYWEQLNSLLDVSDADVTGRLVIDLGAILAGTNNDVDLKDGDEITIPKRTQTITVIGEVYAPNSHYYSGSKGIDDYIVASGGITDYGDDANRYLIKANGSVVPSIASGFFKSGSGRVKLEPGDTIVVPFKIQSYNNKLRATREITQIIYQMALATAAVNSF